MLNKKIEHSVKVLYDEMLNRGALLPKEKLQQCYTIFRSRFGPERLASIDGEELLNTMHAHGNRDSLVYWLEFKDDDEFPAAFGSIAGGSALKFGIYKRKETNTWMTGSSKSQTEISVAQAIEVARKHRDQLIAGAKLLEDLSPHNTDENYYALQERMRSLAPDVSDTGWGHKYFSLLHPDKLDNYHTEEYQRFHLIKMLEKPPEAKGRYVIASRFVRVADALAIPLNHLTAVLNRAHGRPYRVWRIGTRIGDDASIWDLMKQRNCVAIGWSDLGNLSGMQHTQECKQKIRSTLEAKYSYAPQVASRKAGEILDFVGGIADGDIVLAADGEKILGIGKVVGDYRYETVPEPGAPHRRPVQWLDLNDSKLPIASDGLRTTVYPIRRHPENLIAVERRLLDAPDTPDDTPGPVPKPVERLEGISGRVEAILDRKGQVILYGPPGTGKTHWAREAAFDLASLGAFGRRFALLRQEERATVCGDAANPGLVRFCTFHPSYGYEDFMEGYRPVVSAAGQLAFERRAGVFKRLCTDAAGQPDRRFYMLVDEINRGDIPRIFGELLTLLELDKRGQTVQLPLSGERFSVPGNVYVIGTMNTADRSIALLDTALRRRFGFIELMPDMATLANTAVGGRIPLGPWLAALNDRIRTNIGRDARNLQIGHAYLLQRGRPVSDLGHFSRILADDIIPLLEEYCYEDYSMLSRILGVGLIDESRQRVRSELFAPAQLDELVQAVLAPCPEIATSPQAVTTPEKDDEPDEDAEQDEAAA